MTLLEKLEGAEEGSRELDAEIWWEHGPGPIEWPDYKALDAVMACGVIFGRVPKAPIEWGNVGYRGPTYTTSIDAALTFADGEEIERVGGKLAILRWAIDLLQSADASFEDLPRFICIASLRAREASDAND